MHNIYTDKTPRFYNDGYQEGKQEVIDETRKSGKMLGIQTAYQRLILIGMIVGYLTVINDTKKEEFKKLKGRLSLEDINIEELMTNDDKSIEKLDKLIKKSRNWVQMNSFLRKSAEESIKIPKMNVVDELILKVTGQTPNSSTSQNNNLEDW